MAAVPTDVWSSRLSSTDAPRGPHVEERDGQLMWVCEDRVLGQSGRRQGGDTEALKKLSAIGRAGIEDDGYRAGNAKLRLEDLDRDGLAASVIYGPLAIGLTISDPELQSACFAAWNDWAAEDFNQVAPDRLSILGFLPLHSADAAAAELDRCADLGLRGAIIDVFEMDLADRKWDRLWSTSEETGLPISLHIKAGSWSGLSYQLGKWQAAAFATIMPLQLDEILATLIFSGVLERHEQLQLVLAESGISWLPFFLARADMEWNALKDKLDYAPKLSPSELFHRNLYATFEEEWFPEQIAVLGADRCMWASDYPHTDSTFPHSLEVIEETLGVLTAEDRRKVTATNCAQLYGFAIPA
jgi:predicted TIM-barrel fold metal-dependent hydrolase